MIVNIYNDTEKRSKFIDYSSLEVHTLSKFSSFLLSSYLPISIRLRVLKETMQLWLPPLYLAGNIWHIFRVAMDPHQLYSEQQQHCWFCEIVLWHVFRLVGVLKEWVQSVRSRPS
eukprot:TRINITY_DN23471_c0_g1_i2.p1 TRINITY_DN23471_c0_g1~~TRINITY_DN23471_c0_g1_i2.p1  ORF type:complete len:115 (-),score=13.29 TRINITY_DN23471_c0_g1_i2:36-380(-)